VITPLRAEFSAAFLNTSYASSIWAKVNEWVPIFSAGGGRWPPSSAGWGWTRQLEAAQVTAIGAFERATVGWFDPAAKQYRRILVGEQCEVLSLIGDVAEGQDGPTLHAHVVLGLSDGTTRGGHLLEGRVFPTLEVVVTETPAELRKVMRPDLGIALIDLDRSES
jgi:uncharacterized protein